VIALENRADPYHVRAKELDERLLKEGAVLFCHWGVLIEIADGFARIARRARGLDLLARITSEDGYDLISITQSLLQAGLDLYRSRADKEWGLTDCISFVLMKKAGVDEALTADLHFRQAGFKAMLLDGD
jgi:predicted nucleic acid-binding protein